MEETTIPLTETWRRCKIRHSPWWLRVFTSSMRVGQCFLDNSFDLPSISTTNSMIVFSICNNTVGPFATITSLNECKVTRLQKLSIMSWGEAMVPRSSWCMKVALLVLRSQTSFYWAYLSFGFTMGCTSSLISSDVAGDGGDLTWYLLVAAFAFLERKMNMASRWVSEPSRAVIAWWTSVGFLPRLLFNVDWLMNIPCHACASCQDNNDDGCSCSCCPVLCASCLELI